MQTLRIVDIAQHRIKKKQPAKRKQAKEKKGSVYARSGKLWVDFRYLGQRIREPIGLKDTKENIKTARKQLDLITAEIENGIFDFTHRFPSSKKRDFITELEGKTVKRRPDEVLFKTYAEKWFESMSIGMSKGETTDYRCILKNHIYPYFNEMTFDEFNPVLIKKFLAVMKNKQNRYGNPLSAKRIRNVFIPLRNIVRDAYQEHGWFMLFDPFVSLKLPKPLKFRVQPFNFEEWELLIENMTPWYRPYFNFAVQTGLRPSEQVALKWTAIDDDFIHIVLSRVRNVEKAELKTQESNRMIMVRQTLAEILKEQKLLSEHFDSPYVFLNMNGLPIKQENLRSIWHQAMEKSGLDYRRMYETRHTFASWALALGETPEWVARTLGHVDTSMVYRTYGRYIPNLTKLDGSLLEKRFTGTKKEECSQNVDTFGHNFGHNGEISGRFSALTYGYC